MRVLVSCANGSGTSLMLSMTVKKAFESLGIKITKMHHCAIAEGKSSATMYDIVFTSPTFVNQFSVAQKKGIPVHGIKNVMSVQEVIDSMNKGTHE